MWDIIVRFIFGGLTVSLFAALGEVFQPKTFAGIFSAAPSVAVVTLALAFRGHGPAYVATESRSMIVGAVGLAVYSTACLVSVMRRRLPVWAEAAACWIVWLVTAFSLYACLRALGAM